MLPFRKMNILTFFLYFLSFFPGFVCIVLGVVGWVKSRNPLIRLYLLFFIPVSLALFISLFEYFFGAVARVPESDAVSLLLIQIRAVIRSPVFYFIPLFFHGFVGRSFGRVMRAIFLTLIPVAAVSPILVYAATRSELTVIRFYTIVYPCFFYFAILYSLLVLILHRKGVDSPEKRLLIRGFLCICVPMVPILAFQYLNYYVLPVLRMRYFFFLDYLFYSAWSVFYSYYLIRTVFLAPERGATGGAKYLKSRIPDAEAERCRTVIESLMERDALYRDSGLTLGRLSSLSGISRNHISQVLSMHRGTTFYDFINAYRVREAKRLLSDPGCGLSILEIAFEAGFNSKTTFYAAFKKLEGVNPADFRERAAATKSAPVSGSFPTA